MLKVSVNGSGGARVATPVKTIDELIPLFAPFVRGAPLVFDVGANLGEYAQMFLDAGAHKVIAIEPMLACNPLKVAKLEEVVARNPNRIIPVPAALSDRVGTATITENIFLPYMESIDTAWIETSAHASYYAEDATRRYTVPTTTLDELIAQYGIPAFVKIDVEGHEGGVVAGLSVAVQALNFEFHHDWLGDSRKCVEQLATLGQYEYNLALNVHPYLEMDEWGTWNDVLNHIERIGHTTGPLSWGDVYARLIEDDYA